MLAVIAGTGCGNGIQISRRTGNHRGDVRSARLYSVFSVNRFYQEGQFLAIAAKTKKAEFRRTENVGHNGRYPTKT